MMTRRTMLSIGGAIALALILIIGYVFFLLPQVTAATTNSASTATPQATAKAAHKNPYAKPLKQYSPDIKKQMAQGLKLDPNQLTAQLQAGKSLKDIATAQGLSSAQLQDLIASSLQNGLKPAVDSGQLTQQQLTMLIQRNQKNPATLEHLLGAKAKKNAAPEGTATPTAVK